MASKSFDRLRAIACRYWSIAPPQFDAWIDEGRISFVDVLELVMLLAHDPVVGIWLFEYLHPEAKAREAEEKARADRAAEEAKRKHRNDITVLTMLMKCKPKNEAEAAKIEALKEQLRK